MIGTFYIMLFHLEKVASIDNFYTPLKIRCRELLDSGVCLPLTQRWSCASRTLAEHGQKAALSSEIRKSEIILELAKTRLHIDF